MGNKIGIIDYRMGNIGSLSNAISALGYDVVQITNHCQFENVSKILLPGVGAFAKGMHQLVEMRLVDALCSSVVQDKKPIMGICLGLQLLAESSTEGGLHEGLGLIKGRVDRIAADGLRIPHMGWNNVDVGAQPSLFNGVGLDLNFYFIHSYCLKDVDPSIVAAYCEYGERFPASIQQGNIYATQFHPEKSHRNGLVVLYNFLTGGNEEGDSTAEVVVDRILKNALSDDRLEYSVDDVRRKPKC